MSGSVKDPRYARRANVVTICRAHAVSSARVADWQRKTRLRLGLLPEPLNFCGPRIVMLLMYGSPCVRPASYAGRSKMTRVPSTWSDGFLRNVAASVCDPAFKGSLY